jgi:type IV pilus assembly protein PilV
MIAVLVISIGLLGIAKMEALSLSNTGNSRLRALASLEVAGLASTMQADRGYWAQGVPLTTTPFTVTIAGTTITSPNDATLQIPPNCLDGNTCTVAQMAALDLQNWAGALNGVIPNDQVTIACQVPAATGLVSCQITVSWAENLVNANSAEQNTAAATTALATPQYVMVVEP